MKEYHKIQTVFKRDGANNFKTLLEGEYSKPEFEYLKNNVWEFTEKVDGTNIRIIWNGGNLEFKGKTDRADIPKFLLEKLNDLFKPEMFEDFDEGSCLYGEGYGAKIQKGGGNYISEGVSFCLFDIHIGDWWLKRETINEIAENFNLDRVPIIGVGSLSDMVDRCKNGFKSQWGDFQAEGIVARPPVELFSRNGERIITKIKCKDFVN